MVPKYPFVVKIHIIRQTCCLQIFPLFYHSRNDIAVAVSCDTVSVVVVQIENTLATDIDRFVFIAVTTAVVFVVLSITIISRERFLS